MIRILLRAVVLLVLGAVLTLALAWAAAAVAPVDLARPPERRSVRLPSGERVPYLHWREGTRDLLKWHLLMIRSEEEAQGYPLGPGPWWSRVADAEAFSPDPRTFINVRVEMASGWPMRSMRWGYVVIGSKDLEPKWCAIRLSDHTTVEPWSLAKKRALPLQPLWFGFAVDTLALAALLLPVPLGWRWLVRRWRRRAGRCAACGYPWGTAEVCAECGCPLPARPAATRHA